MASVGNETPLQRTWTTEGYFTTCVSDYVFDRVKGDVYWYNADRRWKYYRGESSVVIMGFSGFIRYNMLLQLLGSGPLCVHTGGRVVPFLARTVVIHSYCPPETWYKGQWKVDKCALLSHLLKPFCCCPDERTKVACASRAIHACRLFVNCKDSD